MTKITFFKRDGIFYGFRENGHTGYGESGDDILCSALSAMTMLIINTVEIGEDEKKRYAISGLIQGYFFQLNDLVEDYYDYLSVEEIEN